MLRKILIGFGIGIGLIVLLAAIGFYYYAPDKSTVLKFIKANPEKTAILLIRNDSILAETNTNRIMPLASTVKIIIAIEYAIQSSAGKLNSDSLVELSELDKYYIPNTDGGAHPNWKQAIKDKIKNNKISIREVAKGMIKFSSNANTEWLMWKLGLDKINARLDSLKIKDHTKLYYIVSALFVGKEAFPEIKETQLVNKLKALRIEDYINYTNIIHDKLNADTIYKTRLGDLSMDIQRVWSDKLPSSTVSEYVAIMKKINSREYFSKETQQYLDEVMEYILENPTNRKWLEHSGMKGGSTAFVLTKALYATDKKANKTELAYFFNDLSILEMVRLQMSMNEFELNILTKGAFRQKIIQELVR